MQDQEREYVQGFEDFEILATTVKEGGIYKIANFEKDNEEFQIEIPVRVLKLERIENTERLYYVTDDDVITEIFD